MPPGLAPPGVGATLQVQHELRAPESARRSTCDFSGESLASPGAGGNGSFFALQGEAESASTVGEDGLSIDAKIACASTYLVECRNSASVGLQQQLPPPAYAEQRGKRAVATFYVSASPVPTSNSPITLRFHVLTSTATSLDPRCAASCTDESALDAARRSLMAVGARACVTASGTVAAATATALVAAHDAAWALRWATYVDVSGADSRIRWALRYAFYNLHACTSARPMGGALDLAGTSLAGGRTDDFVATLLTLCAPDSARSALEGRWALLSNGVAHALASDAGLPGGRFPHADELDGDESFLHGDEDQASLAAQDAAAALSGYSPNSWWQLGSAAGPAAVRLHATSMAAVSAWNYYRATQDNDWLVSRGFPIIKNAADTLAALCVCPDSSSHSPVYRLPASVGLDVLRPGSRPKLSFGGRMLPGQAIAPPIDDRPGALDLGDRCGDAMRDRGRLPDGFGAFAALGEG